VDSPVFSSLIPVILCIGIGFFAARMGWVRAAAIPDFSNLVFLVLTPALLFRTMGAVRIQELNFRPVALYFLAAGLMFAATMVASGFSTRAAARGLAAISVFIEPLAAKNNTQSGMSTSGAFNIFRRTIGDKLITVLGEVPPQALMRIADGVEMRKR
jgi:predicted permease